MLKCWECESNNRPTFKVLFFLLIKNFKKNKEILNVLEEEFLNCEKKRKSSNGSSNNS